MKKQNLLMSTAIAGILTVCMMPHIAKSESSEVSKTVISKPQGAMGMGTVAPMEAKSNQFWWPDQLDLSALRDHDVRSNPLSMNNMRFIRHCLDPL